MKPVIFFRHIESDRAEYKAAKEALSVYEQRVLIPRNSLVIPRYSALPNYRELEADVRLLGGRLLNTYEEHRFIADIRKYVPVLGDLTPKTWETWGGLPEGQYVVKGITNSRKQSWNTCMFCPTVADVPKVASRLMDDAEILEQGLVVRQYVPLVQYGVGINGLPVTNEWRFFVLHDHILACGYYWVNDTEDYPHSLETPPQGAVEAVQEAIARIQKASTVPFYVVDVGERADGGWIVIELNDGQQSGLPHLDPFRFYKELRDRLVVSRYSGFYRSTEGRLHRSPNADDDLLVADLEGVEPDLDPVLEQDLATERNRQHTEAEVRLLSNL